MPVAPGDERPRWSTPFARTRTGGAAACSIWRIRTAAPRPAPWRLCSMCSSRRTSASAPSVPGGARPSPASRTARPAASCTTTRLVHQRPQASDRGLRHLGSCAAIGPDGRLGLGRSHHLLKTLLSAAATAGVLLDRGGLPCADSASVRQQADARHIRPRRRLPHGAGLATRTRGSRR